jgi:hypothetical protein
MNTPGRFRDLDPPAGGAQRLRLALAKDGRERRNVAVPLTFAATLGLLVVAWAAWPPAASRARQAEARAAVESVLRPPAGGFEPRSARVLETPASPEGVRFYVLDRQGGRDG